MLHFSTKANTLLTLQPLLQNAVVLLYDQGIPI